MLFRLAKRLDQNLRGSIVNQVEYRLSLAERIKLTNPRTASQRRPSAFDAARWEARPGGHFRVMEGSGCGRIQECLRASHLQL